MRQNENRRRKNKSLKTRIKNRKKDVQAAVDAENEDQARDALHDLYGICDSAAQKGAIHKNKASRIKSRMTDRVNQIGDDDEA